MHLNKKNKKFSIIFLLIVFLFVFNVSFVWTPKQVHAQNVDFSNLALNSAKWIWEKITTVTTFLWQKGGSVAFQRALRSFSNQLAYKAADQIATGKAGGGVAWFTKLATEEAKKAGEAAGAEFLDNLASGYGINICEPPTVNNFKFDIAIGLKETKVAGELKPRCTLDEMKKKWGDFAVQLKNPTSIISLNDMSLMDLMRANGISVDAEKSKLTPQERREMQAKLLEKSISIEDSELSYITDTAAKLEEDMKKAEESLVANRNSNAGATGIRTPITEELITPADLSERDLKAIKERNEDVKTTGDIVVDTANIFLNTLVSKSLENLIKNLMKQDPPQADSSDIANGMAGGSYSNKRESVIDEIFSTINRISININPREINLISELEMDLGDEFVGRVNNKTIDSKFADVLRRSETEPITVQEAMDENLLEGDKYFGFINISGINNQPELDDGYSYDNIKKLRKNRVVPVGWEFAALKTTRLSPTNYPEGCDSKGCKLSAVVNGYDKAGTFRKDNITIKDDYCGQRNVEMYHALIEFVDGFVETAVPPSIYCNQEYFPRISGLIFQYKRPSCYRYGVDENQIVVSTTIVSGYNNASTCNNDKTSEYYQEWVPGGCFAIEEDESPFCHLVDPNWVLKAPKQQCASDGYYSALESSDSSMRYKDCADTKNCLKEDDNGNCLGWGYCLKEKNIWKFRGKKCDENSAGCTTLKDDAGKTKSYILDTMKSCPQDEVGCKEYANKKIDIDTNPNDYVENYVWATSTFNFFNNKVSSCEAQNAGCTKFIEVVPGLNLVPNPSFEIDEDENSIPDGWLGSIISTSTASFDGAYSALCTAGSVQLDISKSKFNILNQGLYTLSYRVKGSGSVTPKLIYKLSGDHEVTSDDANYSANESNWISKSGYFGIDNPGNTKIDNPQIIFNITGDVYIDAVQFELNHYESSSTTGAGAPSMYNNYGEKGIMYFKKAPSYYNCQSNNSYIRSKNCSNYAQYCSKDDVGCESYKPANGEQSVFSIVSQSDICPSECDNYQTFSQYPSYFQHTEDIENDPDHSMDMNNVDFIPETAKDCPPSMESCELFTNIDKVNKGGEGKEYYSYLRQCVKPSAVTSTVYYTWEGSDTSGFQLKTWKLLKSNLDDAPCTNIRIGTNTCIDLEPISKCDPDLNLECRVFYDKSGIAHNRFIFRTIPITDECVELRREASIGFNNDTNQNIYVDYKAVPSMSAECDAKNVGCRRYKGNKGDNVRNVLLEDFESASVSKWDNVGEPSGESVAYNGHSMKVSSVSELGVTLKYNLTENGQIINPGKKYTLEFWAKSQDSAEENLVYNILNIKNLFAKINPFNLSKVFAESESDGIGQGTMSNDDVDMEFGLITLDGTKEWHKYIATSSISVIPTSGSYILKFIIKLPDDRDSFFIDNIRLKEITSDFYKIKDSWITPKICSDGDYLRCQKYFDRDNNPWYFYQFNNTCKEANVGCSAMIDTKNSEMPFQQTYNAYCNDEGEECNSGKSYYKNYFDINSNNQVTSTITVATDELVYMVKQRKDLCTLANKGCSAFGFSEDGNNYKDVYKINNPDNYIQDDYYGSNNKILCLSGFADCTAFSIPGGGMTYKIHPRNRVCEYKEAAEGLSAGYYEVNSPNDLCDDKIYNENYSLFVDDPNKSDDDWLPFEGANNNYSVSCDKKQNKCSMFIDPTDAIDMTIEATNATESTINFSQKFWTMTSWDAMMNGNVAISNLFGSDPSGNISARVLSSAPIIIYADPRPGKNSPFNFYVKKNSTYRLSAKVKFDGNGNKERVRTFLSCGPMINNKIIYLKDADGDGNDSLPYAFPSIKSDLLLEEKDNKLHSISGLYKMLPGVEYCNVAFYILGRENSIITLKDIKFEEVTGDYYYIDNIELDRTGCSKASFEEGCILFNNISKIDKTYNASKSYEDRSLVGNNPEFSNDSNELFKVIRDRECGEWEACSSKITTKDYQGNDKSSCIALMACNKLSSSGDCANYLPKNQKEKVLNLDKYNIDLGAGKWSNMSYSGYSIPGTYAPHTLSAFSVIKPVSNYDNSRIASTSVNMLGYVIKKEEYTYKQGVSYTDPLDSNNFAVNNTDVSCRLYPEKDSPFSWTKNNKIVSDYYTATSTADKYVITTGIDSSFQNANIAQPMFGVLEGYDVLEPGQSSDCSYTKADYGSQSLFFPYEANNIPKKINIKLDNDLTSTLNLKKSVKNLGWPGFCMEYDKSLFINTNYNSSYSDPDGLNYRCLSWYPVDLIGGGIDSSSYAPEADITYNRIPENGKMCMVGETYSTLENRVYCAYWSNNTNESAAGLYGTMDPGENGSGATQVRDHEARCNVLVFVPAHSTFKKDGITEEFFEYFQNNYKTSDYVKRSITPPTKNIAYEIIYGSNWPQWYRENVFSDNFACTNYSASGASTRWWQEKEKKFQESEFNNYAFPIDAIGDKDFIQNFKTQVVSPNGYNLKFYWYDEGVRPTGQTVWGGDGNDGVYEWDDINNSGYRTDYNGSGGVSELNEKIDYYIPVGFGTWTYDGGNSNSSCGAADSVGDAYRNSCWKAIEQYGTIASNIPNGHEAFTNCLGGDNNTAEGVWNYLPYNYYVNYNVSHGGVPNATNIVAYEPMYTTDNVWTCSYPGCTYTDPFYTKMSSNSATCGTASNPCLQHCKSIADIKTTGTNRTIFKANNIYLASIPLLDISNGSSTIQLPNDNNVWVSYCKLEYGAANPLNCPLVILGNETYYGQEKRLRKDNFWTLNQGQYNFVSSIPIPNFGILASNDSIENIGRRPILADSSGLPYFSASIFTSYVATGTLSVAQNDSKMKNWIVKVPTTHLWDSTNLGEDYEISKIDWNFTGTGFGFLPNINSVTSTGEGILDRFSINSITEADVVTHSANGNLVVDMTFYAYADANQTPIRQIKICWNGTNDCFDFPGIFKNRKHECQRFCGQNYSSAILNVSPKHCSTNADCSAGEKCFAKTWGDTEEACIEDSGQSRQYFKFSNVYVCNPMSSEWKNVCDATTGKGCCEYKPNLTVTDNWGKSKKVYIGPNEDSFSIKVFLK